MRNRRTKYTFLLLIAILLFCDFCFAFIPNPNVELHADKLDRKYFPVFLKTLDMIEKKEFENLNKFFSDDLLIDKRQSFNLILIKSWSSHRDIYFKFRKTTLLSDSKIGKKGYSVQFPINWAANPINNTTWVFSFQNLLWLNKYLDKGERGDDVSTLTAFKIIHDWIISNAQWPAKYGKFVYGDHSTAERLKIFRRAMRLYKNSQYKDDEFFKLLLTGILNHIALMSTKERYLNWHNHGIIFDIRLLEVLKDFPEFKNRKELQDLAIRRCLEQFRFAFTSEGVHKEHSPCYHYSVTCMLLKSVDLIEESGQNVPVFLKDLADKSSEFYTYILKSDGTFPNFGDCSGSKRWSANGEFWHTYLNGHPQLKYALTEGATGKPLSELFKVFPDSGWAIFRDKWPPDVYAAIQSDFHSWGHYQEDDTSFILNAFGHDFIIDAGIHTYNKDALDIYMRKSRAHNVLIVDDTDFNFNLANTGLSGITRHRLNKDQKGPWKAIVELTHAHYNYMGVTVYRQFGQIGNFSFMIKDIAGSKSPHKYTQLYHLAPGAKVEPKTAGTFKISWQTHPYVLWLRSNFDSYDIIEGSMNPVQGWYFPEFGVSVSQPVLRLNKKGESIQFLTFIGIGHGDQEPAWDGMILSSDKMSHAIESLPRQMLKKQPVPERWVPSRKRLSSEKEPQQFQDKQARYFEIGLRPLNIDLA